jgi:hypothetical protein
MPYLVLLTLYWQYPHFNSHWKLVKKVSCVEGGVMSWCVYRYTERPVSWPAHKYVFRIISLLPIHSFVAHSIPPKQEHLKTLWIPSQTNCSLTVVTLICNFTVVTRPLAHLYCTRLYLCTPQRHAGSRRITPLILHPGTTSTSVVSFTPSRFSSCIQRAPVATKQEGESVWEYCWRQISCLCWELNRDTSVIQCVQQSLYRLHICTAFLVWRERGGLWNACCRVVQGLHKINTTTNVRVYCPSGSILSALHSPRHKLARAHTHVSP